MKNYFLPLCLFLMSSAVFGQRFEISGTIVDKENGQPLESATVFVERLSDSTLVSYTISDPDGKFTIEGSERADKLRLAASYAGYLPLSRVISLENERNLDLGRVEMEVATNILGEVMVEGTRAPVTIKSDTLEFNADSFSTRPDANLEEVMKKLPGVEVDAQGNITVNGKPVSRILVNGKEFFGNDPQIATKNLPKEIIDKIQVVDTKTRTEQFTGKAGNPDDKTINITIKEDKNRGYFARATAGGGTDDRYELSGIGNYFQDDLRFSVLASSNNINSSGFSFDEVFDMMGRRGVRSMSFNGRGGFSINGTSFGGAGGGITKSETAGFNFTNDWNKKYELNGDYFFGRNDTETMTIVERENFLPERTYYTNSISEGNLVNDSHRANAVFEINLDTLTRISIRPSVQINDGFSRRSGFAETLDENRELTNSTTTLDNESLYSSNFNNRLDFIRRFGARGAYLQFNFQNRNDKQENENNFFSERAIYENGETSLQVRDQFIDEDNQSDEYRFGVTQRSVLANKLFLDLSYDFSTETSNNQRNVFDYNETSDRYDLYNEELSNAFEVVSLQHIPNAGLNYEGTKFRGSFSVGLLNTSLKNENFIAETSFDKDFNDLYINSYFRYEIKRGKSLYMNYRTSTNVPSIRQLQPVPDVTNPVNIIVGNPELDATYSHRVNFGFNNFDFASRSGMNVYGSFSLMQDQVVPYTITGRYLMRTTTYTNVDGGMDANVGSFFTKRYKRENSEFSYRIGGNISYNRQLGFTNQLESVDPVKYTADNYAIRPGVSLSYNYRELIDITPRYDLGYVLSHYDISNNREEEYTNHSIGVNATSYWPKNIIFGNDVSYNYFGNVAPGFDPTSLLWNMSLGYQFLNDNATLKVKVYDLLNENVSTSRTTGQDYVQDTQELILQQYYMLSFTYKLSKFGGSDPNRGRGGTRMIRF